MNLTIRVFGLELLCIDASTETEPEYDGSGTTASSFGFVAEVGDELGLPDRPADE